MQPLTTVLPKPALPLPDGPVIASALHLAAETGVDRIVVNVYHLSKRMAEVVASERIEGIEIVLSHERELMGTAGGIALARDRGLLGNEGAVLVINGDGALGLDLQDLVSHHSVGNDLVTLALLPHLDPERWSRVTLDPDGRVEKILAPGLPSALEVPLLYPGVMAVSREALEALPTCPGETPSALWGPAQAAQRLGGVVVTGHWREVGTPADYLEVMRARLAGMTLIEDSAEVGESAKITRSFIGPKAAVSDGAVIEDSIISEGAVIGERAHVVRSLLFGSVKIEAEEKITDTVRASQRASR